MAKNVLFCCFRGCQNGHPMTRQPSKPPFPMKAHGLISCTTWCRVRLMQRCPAGGTCDRALPAAMYQKTRTQRVTVHAPIPGFRHTQAMPDQAQPCQTMLSHGGAVTATVTATARRDMSHLVPILIHFGVFCTFWWFWARLWANCQRMGWPKGPLFTPNLV